MQAVMLIYGDINVVYEDNDVATCGNCVDGREGNDLSQEDRGEAKLWEADLKVLEMML